MKINVLLIGVALLFANCRKDEIAQSSSGILEKEFEIKLNESVTIKSSIRGEENASIGTIQFSNLEESRCPANAMCIRQGAAVTSFRIITNASGEAQTVRLFVGDFMADDPRKIRNRSADTVAIQLANKARYQLILKQVMPYPGTTTKHETSKATIVVKMN